MQWPYNCENEIYDHPVTMDFLRTSVICIVYLYLDRPRHARIVEQDEMILIWSSV